MGPAMGETGRVPLHPPEPPTPVTREVMRMWWLDLTFIHTPVDPAAVDALIPDNLRVDTWPDADGVERAWIGLVPFIMKVGFPGGRTIPVVGTFPETNVRTYVIGPDGTPGVWFCSLEAAGLAATLTARGAYGLPYFWADMTVERDADEWTYDSRRRWPRSAGQPRHHSRVRVGERVDDADVSPFEHFLSARWGLFSRWPTPNRGTTVYAAVDHPRWPLHRAELLELDDSLMTAAGRPAPAADPVVHWSPGVEVRIGRPRLVRR